MNEALVFYSRKEFRNWLDANCLSSEGVWLAFGKNGQKTIKADEALEEALCFGWIDGQMKSIDDKSYVKYFSQRRKNSKWSEKNKSLAKALEERGIMTDFGREKIEEAKSNGQWDAPKQPQMSQAHIDVLCRALNGCEPALSNFSAMPPSVKKTYAKAYFDAKTESGRQKRLSWIIDRLNKNLKPM